MPKEGVKVKLSELLVPTYVQTLRAVVSWLEKARDQDGMGDDIMSRRLAPDMFPLSTQIRFVCVQAREGVHRLRDDALPEIVTEILDEGRQAGENPGTIADAITRLEDTIAFVESVSPDTMDGRDDEPLELALPVGLTFDLTGDQYARDWALPQFYFHVMTTYAVLRQQGATLGKADYVPHMFAYKRGEPRA